MQDSLLQGGQHLLDCAYRSCQNSLALVNPVQHNKISADTKKLAHTHGHDCCITSPSQTSEISEDTEEDVAPNKRECKGDCV